MMDRETLMRRRREVVRDSGPWINHSIYLDHGLFTEPCDPRARRAGWDDLLLRRVVQIARDSLPAKTHEARDFSGARVLDLAALEGLYAIEFARRGAQVVATDLREEHLAKVRFVRDVLDLEHLEVRRDDVRNLNARDYGSFDVSLCLGLLYHLDANDALGLLRALAEVTTRVAVIDTHFAHAAEKSVLHDGQRFWGRVFVEHGAGDDDAQQMQRLTASVGNARSFWFTRRSLVRALLHAGFSSVQEVLLPRSRGEHHADRITLVAVKGEPVRLLSCPDNNALRLDSWPPENAPQPASVVHLPNNVPSPLDEKFGRVALRVAKRSARTLALAKKGARAARRGVAMAKRVAHASPATDAAFDKYRLQGAYHWPMLAQDASYRARVSLVAGFLENDSRCLDLGCGDGAYVEVLAPHCAQVCGVDADATGITLAQSLLADKGRANTQLLCATFHDLNASRLDELGWRERFDAIYAMDCIEHLHAPEELLRVARECLTPEGTFLVGTPEFVSSEEVSPYHHHEFSEVELRALLETEFRVERVLRLPAPLRTTGRVQQDRFLVAVCRSRTTS